MALIDCIECSKTISSRSAACPICGAPQQKPPPAPTGHINAAPHRAGTKTREKVVLGLALVVGAFIFLQPKNDTTAPKLSAAQPKRGLTWDIDVIGRSTFSEDDKRLFKAAAEKVLRDDPICDQVYGGDRPNDLHAWNNPQRKPYYVTCLAKDGKDAFNIFFNATDISSDAPLRGPSPFDESASRRLCERAIKGKASHPSTVDIHSIMGYATSTSGSGMRVVRQDFTAKNDYGLELKFRAHCYVDSSGELGDIDIFEKGQ
jgi:hypothetical protein